MHKLYNFFLEISKKYIFLYLSGIDQFLPSVSANVVCEWPPNAEYAWFFLMMHSCVISQKNIFRMKWIYLSGWTDGTTTCLLFETSKFESPKWQRKHSRDQTFLQFWLIHVNEVKKAHYCYINLRTLSVFVSLYVPLNIDILALSPNRKIKI